MKTLQQQIFCSLVFLTCLLAASLVQAATFDMVFFDNARNVVGKGQFSTDPNRQICVEASFGGNCDIASIPGQIGQLQYDHGLVVDRKNPVTAFEADIQGQGHYEQMSKMWWADEGQLPGYQFLNRNGTGLSSGEWFFGDESSLTGLLLDIEEATDKSGAGSWRLSNLREGT
jgi:hypothetical protein